MVYNIHFSVVNVSTGIYNSLTCYRGIKMQKEKNLNEVCRVPSLIFRILKKKQQGHSSQPFSVG